MSVEVEIKLKIEDPEQLIEKLEGLGFIKGEQLMESDTYFTSEDHDFVKLGEALRVRQIRNVDTDEISAVITYKGKKLDDCSMAREELELEIPDAEVGKTLLQRIGFYSVPVLEKKRWYFRRNEMTACVVRMFITNLKSTLKIRLKAHIFPRTFADLLPLCYDYNTKH